MQYRKFGKLDFEVSALGFGCMRLPKIDEKVNVDEAISMIRYAADHGVNYFDTAYVYHGGESEVVLGKALQGGYRERVKIATKLPLHFVKEADDFDRLLDEQLRRLQVDCIDFYLFHNVGRERWTNTILKLGLIEKAEEAKKAGKIKHIGFSFHDDYDAFKTIIDGYDRWEFCQIQYNYMDTENQAGTKGLKYAASKGLPVVVMEPLLGGKLANPPEMIKQEFEKSGKGHTVVDLALQWLWNQPEVTVVLSGMSTMKQVKENIESANRSAINSMKPEDLELIEKVRRKYNERIVIPCTKCSYCMPCPNGVDIPRNFELYNEGFMYDSLSSSRFAYNNFVPEPARAKNCIGCRVCEDKCPQRIEISQWMPKVHETLGENRRV